MIEFKEPGEHLAALYALRLTDPFVAAIFDMFDRGSYASFEEALTQCIIALSTARIKTEKAWDEEIQNRRYVFLKTGSVEGQEEAEKEGLGAPKEPKKASDISCHSHVWPGPVECPWCRIDRLKAECDSMRKEIEAVVDAAAVCMRDRDAKITLLKIELKKATSKLAAGPTLHPKEARRFKDSRTLLEWNGRSKVLDFNGIIRFNADWIPEEQIDWLVGVLDREIEDFRRATINATKSMIRDHWKTFVKVIE